MPIDYYTILGLKKGKGKVKRQKAKVKPAAAGAARREGKVKTILKVGGLPFTIDYFQLTILKIQNFGGGIGCFYG